MQASYYKNCYVVPAVHERGPRDYYATFCIDNVDSKKLKCFTVRPNFKTKGQAIEAAYKAGRLQVDKFIQESKWKNLIKKFKQVRQYTACEKRKAETVYLS